MGVSRRLGISGCGSNGNSGGSSDSISGCDGSGHGGGSGNRGSGR